MNAPLLIASGLTKTYGGVHALKSVDFELRAGEVHALVGENGAGKSTIIKILSGAVQPDSGVITLGGETVAHNNPVLARRLGISVIYQQPALFPDLTVAENIALTLDNPSPWCKIDWRTRRDRAQTLLDSVGAAIDPMTRVSQLSMPEQQLVEIARALGANAQVLILDEPTASLTDREVEKLFAVIRGMRARGVGLIYVSHRLEELFEIADRVTILRDGTVIAMKTMSEVNRDELIHLMVGRQLSAVFPKREIEHGDVVLEARNLTSKAAGISNVSFAIRAGEILGFAGLVGAGRTELAEVLFGLRPIDSGEILLRGQPARIESPKDAVDLGIAYVPEDRRHHGVILDLSIAANTSLANLAAVSSRGFLATSQERALAADYLQRLNIKADGIDAPVSSLSGGNQQKVCLGKWLATNPSVLILDEPTQGIDVGAKSEVHKLMCDLAARGMAIMMISSELPEVLGMSDRIAVMRKGAITGVLNRAGATQPLVMSLALGGLREAS